MLIEPKNGICTVLGTANANLHQYLTFKRLPEV